ncbi:C2H2-type domain-containing protein [Caenorhabditis elegans]|uniref:C2H2-type domain-containing protein n=1 Tax=Caenorhabditis elegans TaxID=6239 RepID=A0A2K5ATZ8_CAEEL|nr:C2H2-type domain-containing protein [Caenorhabditis elegans]SPC48641.1 C2H2-type domain-containing protein [Caenorhabditis elegans]|eukprot:NP_001348780.1 Putative zinc finger protein B0310.2 [Caenorhabditis elegans]
MEKSQPLSEFFSKQLVDPVSDALRSHTCSEQEMTLLESAIVHARDSLLEEIQRSKISEDVTQTVDCLLSRVDELLEEMPSRKRAKRSLEDTVQMLSKENSVSPPPPSLPFVLPQIPVPIPFSNAALMQRWLGHPLTNPAYLNAMFQHQPAPKPSEEQFAALMKITMHAANFMKTVPQLPVSNHFTESDAEDIKIDVESDEGEIEVSPSPSTGDITENESSSSSTGPMISPNCGDGDCALEKPFICMHNNCGKRFANKFLLKKHMFIHTGLRPHTCPHCHKKFNRKDNLLRHKKTHSPTSAHLGPILPKNPFHGIPQLPVLHNIALTQGFSHFHALKMSLETGATAVRSLS